MSGRFNKGRRKYIYWTIAEKAFGKPLPSTAVVHHVNEDWTDNRNGNLVICQDDSYHKLIHQRARAYYASGHADWLKCVHCKQYGSDVVASGRVYYHRACANQRTKQRDVVRRTRTMYLMRCRSCDWDNSRILNPHNNKPCPRCGGERYLVRPIVHSGPLNRPRRDNRLITFDGETYPLSEWARKLGINRVTLNWRLRHWSVERALIGVK